MPRQRDRAAARERVVDRVQTRSRQGFPVQGVAGGQCGTLLGQAPGRVAQPGQDLVGFQVEAYQRMDDRTQLSHGDGRLETVPRDIADNHGGAGAGQADCVEPAAAVAPGKEDMRGVDGDMAALVLRQQPALHRRRDHMVALEPARVVDAQCDMGGRGQREGDVVVVVRLRPPVAVQAHQSEDCATLFQRDHDQRMGPDRLDQPGALGVRGQPRSVRVELDATGPQVGHRQCERGTGGQPACVADETVQVTGAVATSQSCPPQRYFGPQRAHWRIRAAQHVVHHLDHGEVGEPRYDRVDECLAGGGHIEGPTHPLRTSARVTDRARAFSRSVTSTTDASRPSGCPCTSSRR